MVVPENLVLGQLVRVTNRVNHQSVEAIVVWKGNERPEGWELVVELVNPATDLPGKWNWIIEPRADRKSVV